MKMALLERPPSHRDPMEGSFSFTDFKHYLEGIAGGNCSATTSTAIVRDIQ